ncbi:MAG: recombinase A [Planctomycetota bacterium]
MTVPKSLAARSDLKRGVDCQRDGAPGAASNEWQFQALAGRLVELSGGHPSAMLSVCGTLLRQSQLSGELAAWVGLRDSVFFPPDLAANGIDLEQLPVVLLPEPRSLSLAAELLVRSGAFALVLLDLAAARVALSLADLTRLAGLAKRHRALLLCLTEKSRQTPSLGSLVSLRAEVHRRPLGGGRFVCEVEVIKDKRRALGWTHSELHRGPDGLC